MKKNRVEPTLENPTTPLGLTQALQWYDMNCNSKESKAYLVHYLTVENSPKKDVIDEYVHESYMVNTYGFTARLLSRGLELDENGRRSFWKGVGEIYQKGLEIKEIIANQPPKPIPPKNTLPKYDMKFGEVLHEIDEYINSGCKTSDFRIKKWLVGHKFIKSSAKNYASQLQVEADFINGALNGDKELREAYSGYDTRSLRRLGKFFDGLVQDCLEYAKPAPRTKKVKI